MAVPVTGLQIAYVTARIEIYYNLPMFGKTAERTSHPGARRGRSSPKNGGGRHSEMGAFCPVQATRAALAREEPATGHGLQVRRADHDIRPTRPPPLLFSAGSAAAGANGCIMHLTLAKFWRQSALGFARYDERGARSSPPAPVEVDGGLIHHANTLLQTRRRRSEGIAACGVVPLAAVTSVPAYFPNPDPRCCHIT